MRSMPQGSTGARRDAVPIRSTYAATGSSIMADSVVITRFFGAGARRCGAWLQHGVEWVLRLATISRIRLRPAGYEDNLMEYPGVD